ncbi:MAG: right-handed parallel beta-helix repeat-containing protein, partial [Methanobrevibacter sp.]|nr:right-handed parallel beta-helix repeat-containing protein [Methanobrevibacter sp.]
MNFKYLFLIGVVLILPILFIPDASAKTVTVSGNTFSDVQTAINSASSGDTVYLNNKTFYGTSSSDTIRISAKGNIIIQGKSASEMGVLNARSNCRIMLIGADNTVTFKYVYFASGNSSTATGGAIRTNSKITLQNCNFYNNKGESGAGVCIYEEAAGSSFTNCIFTSNTGIYLGSDEWVEGGALDTHASRLTLRNCTFKSNTAISVGGAVNFANGTTGHQVINCVFSNNNAKSGGAIRLSDFTDLIIQNSNFTNNSASEGGALNTRSIKTVIQG